LIGNDDPAVAPVVELAEPRRTDVCLDYGSGVGQAAFAVAPLVHRLEAVDDDGEILREAERLGAELGCDTITYRQCDLLALPFSPSSFDLVLCHLVLHRLVEPLAALRELHRVVRPGGRIVVFDAVVDESTDRYFNELARLREPRHWRHYRVEEYEELFRLAGLREIGRSVTRLSVDLDAWAEAGLASPDDLGVISSRLRSYPVAVQVALDVAYADQRASFSFDAMAVRLER
jgi:SAM-dependent methyltransferase